MTLSDLLKLPLDQLQGMTNEDLHREFSHLLPQIREPIQGMAGASDSPVKRASDKLNSPKQEQFATMLASLQQIKGQLK